MFNVLMKFVSGSKNKESGSVLAEETVTPTPMEVRGRSHQEALPSNIKTKQITIPSDEDEDLLSPPVAFVNSPSTDVHDMKFDGKIDDADVELLVDLKHTLQKDTITQHQNDDNDAEMMTTQSQSGNDDEEEEDEEEEVNQSPNQQSPGSQDVVSISRYIDQRDPDDNWEDQAEKFASLIELLQCNQNEDLNEHVTRMKREADEKGFGPLTRTLAPLKKRKLNKSKAAFAIKMQMAFPWDKDGIVNVSKGPDLHYESYVTKLEKGVFPYDNIEFQDESWVPSQGDPFAKVTYGSGVSGRNSPLLSQASDTDSYHMMSPV